MRQVSAAIALVAVASLSVVVGAGQNRPDFSGDWVLNLKRSTLHPDFAKLQESTVRIVHTDPQFKFERTFVMAGQPRTVAYEVTTNGVETRSERQGMVTVSTMTWSENALLLSQRISLPQGQSATNAVRYELLEGGAVLRAAEDAAGPGGAHHNVWMFDRR